MKGWPTAIAALAALAACGCGTICNLASGDPQIYGGPQKEIAVIFTPQDASEKCLFPPVTVNSGGSDSPWEAVGACLPLALVLADLPLSVVGDTLTLPLAVYLRQNQQLRAERTSSGKPASTQADSPQPFWPEVVNVDHTAPAPQSPDTGPRGRS